MLARRGDLYQRRGEYGKAIADYEAAMKTGGANASALQNNLAYILATSPDDALRDGARAVTLAEGAVAVFRERQDYPGAFPLAQALDTLAAAYAEAGRFEDAVKAQREAIEKATPEQAEPMRKWLRAYEEGKRRRE